MSGDFEKQMIYELGEISGTVKQIDKKVDEMREDNSSKMADLSVRIAALEIRPGKRWETAMSAAISAVVAGVVGYFSGTAANIKP